MTSKAATLLPVLLFLCSVSSSHQTEETAQTLHSQPSPSATEHATSLWHGSPPTATGRALLVEADNTESTSRRMATAAAPIYELKHGLGVFTIASGTGCYEGAKGQAQARFGVVTADVDLFVPSVLDMLDEEGAGASPQDTVFDKVNEDDDSDAETQRRLDSADNRTDSRQCDIFHSGTKSFNQLSISMERRSSPTNSGGAVQDSSTSHHHHGIFRAKEEWFDGLTGEYSLSCVHHECMMSLTFGTGVSNGCGEELGGPCSMPGSMSAFANEEKGMTSLKLQGTTELAYQGAHTNMLVCVENCDGVVGGSQVNTDAEYAETIKVRTFDNNIVQVHSSHGTKAPKAAKGAGGTKAPKAGKGAGGTKAPKAGKSAKANCPPNGVDTTDPTIICMNTDLVLGANGQVSMTPSDVVASSSDNCGVASVNFGVGANGPVTTATFDCTDVGNPRSGDVRAIDTSGNIATCDPRPTVTILDSNNVCLNSF